MHFSVSGGMGAALLSKPETIVDILTTLKRNLSVPVTAKIRLLPDPADTLQLVKIIEKTGVKAIAIHARTKDMRKHETAALERMKPITEANISVPIIHNGDVFERSDIKRVRDITGTYIIISRSHFHYSIFIFY